jgi:hypothetical protein
MVVVIGEVSYQREVVRTSLTIYKRLASHVPVLCLYTSLQRRTHTLLDKISPRVLDHFYCMNAKYHKTMSMGSCGVQVWKERPNVTREEA